MERVGDRGRRAIVLMGIATVVAGAASALYVHATAPATTRPAAPTSGRPWGLFNASFGDALHGALNVYDRDLFAAFLTSDGGRTWRRFSTRAAVVAFVDRDHAVAVDLSPSNRFAMSHDAGRTWQTVAQPVSPFGPSARISQPGAFSEPFFLDPADGWWFGSPPGTDQGGLWRTTDGGRTWRNLAPRGIPLQNDPRLQPVFVDRLRGVLLAAGANTPPALLVTRDGGRTWSAAVLAWPLHSNGQGLIGGPMLLAHGDRLVLAVSTGENFLPSEQSPRLVSISADGGSTWGPWTATTTTFPITTMGFDDAGRLVMADGPRLWLSADLGRTWQSRTIAGPDGQSTRLLSARGGTLLVARLGAPVPFTGPTLVRSLDGGRSWTEIALPAGPAS
jgi:photosystem II stability/assembly factor-like uncharacterized protein